MPQAEKTRAAKNDQRLLCALMGLALLLVVYNWSPTWRAQWMILDDHQTADIIGTRARLPWSEYFTALGNTEISTAGKGIRFRPVFSIFHVLQAALFGKLTGLWYLAHTGIALAFALMLTWICFRVGGVILTAGFLIFELQQTYWFGLFGRLSTTEAYAILGLTLSAYGCIALYRGISMNLVSTAVAFGTVIAAGSKENFVIVAAIPIWLLLFYRKQFRAL